MSRTDFETDPAMLAPSRQNVGTHCAKDLLEWSRRAAFRKTYAAIEMVGHLRRIDRQTVY